MFMKNGGFPGCYVNVYQRVSQFDRNFFWKNPKFDPAMFADQIPNGLRRPKFGWGFHPFFVAPVLHSNSIEKCPLHMLKISPLFVPPLRFSPFTIHPSKCSSHIPSLDASKMPFWEMFNSSEILPAKWCPIAKLLQISPTTMVFGHISIVLTSYHLWTILIVRSLSIL